MSASLDVDIDTLISETNGRFFKKKGIKNE